MPNVVVVAVPYNGSPGPEMASVFGKLVEGYLRNKLPVTPPQMTVRVASNAYLIAIEIDPTAAVPDGMTRYEIRGGKFLSFVHKGPYELLPHKYNEVQAYAVSHKLTIDETRWVREQYWNSPDDKAAKELLTEILVPVY